MVSIERKMDKQDVLQPYNRLFSHKNENKVWHGWTSYSMDEIWKYYVKFKKLVIKNAYYMILFIETSRTGRSINSESRLVVA